MNPKEKQWHDLIYKVFKLYDKDNNGYLDRSEARVMLKKVEQVLNNSKFKADNAAVDKLFAKIDINNDNRITFDELYAAMKNIN